MQMKEADWSNKSNVPEQEQDIMSSNAPYDTNGNRDAEIFETSSNNNSPGITSPSYDSTQCGTNILLSAKVIVQSCVSSHD